jgi:hypothetical protein
MERSLALVVGRLAQMLEDGEPPVGTAPAPTSTRTTSLVSWPS